MRIIGFSISSLVINNEELFEKLIEVKRKRK